MKKSQESHSASEETVTVTTAAGISTVQINRKRLTESRMELCGAHGRVSFPLGPLGVGEAGRAAAPAGPGTSGLPPARPSCGAPVRPARAWAARPRSGSRAGQGPGAEASSPDPGPAKGGCAASLRPGLAVRVAVASPSRHPSHWARPQLSPPLRSPGVTEGSCDSTHRCP